jgi:hypothetical protein
MMKSTNVQNLNVKILVYIVDCTKIKKYGRFYSLEFCTSRHTSGYSGTSFPIQRESILHNG